MKNLGNISRRGFLAGMGAATALAAGCGVGPRPVRDRPRRVILVTLDTLRADHLPMYGYNRDTSPFLASLAEKGCVFDHAVSESSTTGAAHASLFSGVHLPQHKHWYNGIGKIAEGTPSIWRAFGKAGMDTAGFSAVTFLAPLRAGFNTFAYQTGATAFVVEAVKNNPAYLPAREQLRRALDWLDSKDPNEGFALWLHLFDVHGPYDLEPEHERAMAPADEAARDRQMRFWQERQHKEVNRDPADWSAHQFLYDGAIREVDATLNRLHGYLSKRGMAEDTLWWVTSDHGEGLGNHGYFGHGRELHQEQIHVPLIAHWEGGPWAPGRVKTPTHGVDFAPTMRDLFNLGDGPGGFSHAGASLRPLLSGEGDTWPDRALYFQRRRRQPAGPSGSWVSDPKLGWIRYPWKLIYSEEEGSRLYNLADDPYELQDLAGSMQDRVDQMQRAALEAHFQMIAETDPVTDDAFQDEAAEQLRALGYL